MSFFSVLGSHPWYHMTFSHHIYLGFSGLWHFLRHSLSLMTLTDLEEFGTDILWNVLLPGFVWWYFSWWDWSYGFEGGRSPRSSIILIVSRIQAINYDLTIMTLTWSPLLREPSSGFSLSSYHSLEKEVTKQVMWKEWRSTLHPMNGVHIHKLFEILLSRDLSFLLHYFFLIFNHLLTSVWTYGYLYLRL